MASSKPTTEESSECCRKRALRRDTKKSAVLETELSKKWKGESDETNVPLLLRSEFAVHLSNIVSQLDLKSLLRFLRCSKNVHIHAKNESFQYPLKLSVRYGQVSTFHGETLPQIRHLLCFNNRFLRETDLYYIRKTKCFQVEVDKFKENTLHESQQLLRLFKFAGVKKIDYVDFHHQSKLPLLDLIQTYEIRRLFLEDVPMFLRSPPPSLLRLKELRISCSPVSEEEKLIIKEFVISSNITKFSFSDSLPNSFAESLLEMWFVNKRIWEQIDFMINSSEARRLVPDFAARLNLRTITYEGNDELAVSQYPEGPFFVQVSENMFFLVRGDHEKIEIELTRDYQGRSIQEASTRKLKIHKATKISFVVNENDVVTLSDSE